MKKPLISVLVPVYNDGAYLDATLASVAAQSCSDFEVVISDDASGDDSSAIAAGWAGRDPRFRLHRNPVNRGMTRNWNEVLSRAGGEFVVKLDGDDQMGPRCLEELLGEFRREPELHVAYCRTLECDEHLEPIGSYRGDYAFVLNRLDPQRRQLRCGHDWYRLCFADYQLWHSNAQMHRRTELLALGGWDDTWGCASDTDLILRVLEQNRPVVHTPYAGIRYRLRPGSVSDRFRKNRWLVWEGFLVHLLSLSRYARGGGALAPELRKNWWRYWGHLRRLEAERGAEIEEYPEPQRSALRGALQRLEPPPRQVLVEGAIRQKIAGMKRTIGR